MMDFHQEMLRFSSYRQFPFYTMAAEGYIFVFQDIRGKYKSQGKWKFISP